MMKFLGKWTFGQGSDVIQIDITSGQLTVGPVPKDGSEKFNVYGTDTAFIMQAANGKYVVTSGTGYVATKSDSDPINHFALQAGTAGFDSLVDLGLGGGGGSQYFLVNVSGKIGRIGITTTPPTAAQFTKTVITNGIADILNNGFQSPTPDLTWVNISGTDFSPATANIDFTNSKLAHADLSHTTFQQGTAFDDSCGFMVNFSHAVLVNCSIGTCDFTKANFTRANLQQIQADNTIFTGATLIHTDFSDAGNIAKAKFIGADLTCANFSRTLNIVDTDFTKATLINVIFTGSSVTGSMIIKGANLTGGALNNPGGVVTIYPKFIELDSKTNFTRCKLQYLDLTNYDLRQVIFHQANLSNCKLDGTDLADTDFSYATLDNATLTGTKSMHGANFSNASLKNANLTNAQMGALGLVFSLASTTADYKNMLKALKSDDTGAVQTIFKTNGSPISGRITITASPFSKNSWTVQATLPAPVSYTVRNSLYGSSPGLDIYLPKAPAILSNAFMYKVILTGANLIGVNASGASIYGYSKFNSALLEGAQFDNANVSHADFSSANLAGVNFDYANLVNAKFQNSKLDQNANGARASFNGARLQGAAFDGATLDDVVFNNAAIGVNVPAMGNPLAAGVWLFSLSAAEQSLITAELKAAQNLFDLTLDSRNDLQKPGPVSPAIKSQFSTAGVTLSEDALLLLTSELVFWKVSDGPKDWVIFQSFDNSTDSAALGVAKGSDYTPTPQFTLPLSLEDSLKTGAVNKEVVAAFTKAGHPISAAATVSLMLAPGEWQIVNGAPDYNVYSIWQTLKMVGLSTQAAIVVRPAIPNIISAFNNFSMAITNRATVSPIGSTGWKLDNDSENQFNAVKNYIIFDLLPNSATDELDIYGTVMRIEGEKSPTESQYFTIHVTQTHLTQKQLNLAGMVCPNGDFSTSNAANNLPFDQWLRARTPPSPPFCIYDPAGNYYCPT